jgi:hypothetical protein
MFHGAGRMPGKTPDMSLVEYAEPEGIVQGNVPLPVKGVIYHNTAGLGTKIVKPGKRKVPLLIVRVITQTGPKVPAFQIRQGLGIGVQQSLVDIETVPPLRHIRPLRAVQVKSPLPETPDMAMPNIPRLVPYRVKAKFAVWAIGPGSLKDDKGDSGGMAGKNSEIHPCFRLNRPQGKGVSGIHCKMSKIHHYYFTAE